MARNAVKDFLDEPVLYGGVPTPRGEVIAHLKECGYDQRCVDRYLQGLEHAETNGIGMCGGPVIAVGADEYPGEIWEPIDEETFDRLRSEEKAAV
jgi:hypothetical protein